MKKALFLVLYILFFSSSCTKKHENISEKTTNKINTISVIIEEQLWNGEVGDSLRNKLASPVIGLPQEEPLFTINQYSAKFLEGYMKDSRNILVIKRGNKNSFEMVKNESEGPQNIFNISGKTANVILEEIEKNAPTIIEKIRQTEIEENQRIIDTSILNTRRIENKFKIEMHIPTGYNYALEKNKFIWLKKEITSGNTNILIYEVPYTCLKKSPSVIHNIIKMRDSVGNLYIHGTTPRTRMITEDSYAPYLFQTKIAGLETFETKGTWQLENDYMSGPFINYSILDKKNNRILVLEGFCYAPSKEKRDLMFELEAIIKSVKITDAKIKSKKQ